MIRSNIRLTSADGAFTGALLVVAALIAWQCHLTRYTEIQGLSDRLAQQTKLRGELDQFRDAVERARKDTETMTVKLADYQTQLVGAGAERQYLEALTQALDACDVQGESIVPQSPRVEDRFEITPIEIKTKASFARNLCFIHEVESRMPSANLVDLWLQTDANRPDCDMTLLILYYTDRDQSDAASAAANPTISTQGGATNG